MSAQRTRPPRAAEPDELLDPDVDPSGTAFGTSGSEAASELNWLALITDRVRARAAVSASHRWLVLGSLLAGLFALNFTFTVFIVALPRIASEFSTSITVLTWTMTGPLLAYGIAAPMFGKGGDLLGHRRLYLAGLAGAMVAAVATALAPNAWLLIAARTLDGIQGAATGTASMALIMTAFPARERVKAMGWWSLVGAGGPVLGMSLGSPVIQYLGWRALFWIQLGCLVLAFLVVYAVLPRGAGRVAQPHAARRMDWIGSWTLSISVSALMLGLSLGGTVGFTSPGALACFAGTAAGLVGFVTRLRTAAHPLIPLHYFSQRNFVLPMALRCSGNFAYFGAFFLAPLAMEWGYGFSYTKVAFVSIARPLCFAVCSPIAGYAAVRLGERTTAVFGTVALCASLALFALLDPSTPLGLLLVALALSGVGMGVAMPASSATMANAVAEHDFGVMAAAQILTLQVGEVAGIQVLETLQQGAMRARGLTHHSARAALLGTFQGAFVVGAIVAATAVVAAWFLRPLPRESVSA